MGVASESPTVRSLNMKFHEFGDKMCIRDRELPVWMIMIVLFIRSIGTAFHTPALNAVTPLLVPEEQLTKCAGYSPVSYTHLKFDCTCSNPQDE